MADKKQEDNKQSLKVRYKLKKGEKRIKVHGGGFTPEINPDPNDTSGYEFDLPLGDKGKTISLMPGTDELTSSCKLVLPATVHCEFIMEGKEKIGITHKGGKTTIKIPPGAPMWKLKLDKPGKALADKIDKGSDDPVTVEEPEEGEPPDADLLSSIKKVMENTVRLHEFLDDIRRDKTLANWQRKNIIEQALVLIEGAYVHLLLKESMHAINYKQRLELLKSRHSQLDDSTFHNRITSIFTELRDLHTTYTPPAAYKDKIAFLPFLIEEFHEDNEKKYMVSKIIDTDKTEDDDENLDESFEEGVIITHWNGIPIKRAIALNGERNAGSNEYARHARGLERMTIRPLRMSLPPDEHWVDIVYLERETGQTANRRFNWFIADIPQRQSEEEARDDAIKAALGVDIETEFTLRVKKSLFASRKREKIKHIPSQGESHLEWKDIKSDEFYEFRIVKVKNPDLGKFGYFRIYSFDVNDPDYFVNKFIQNIKPKLQEENTKGLIIDVRGNGGGLITAGERLLQVITQNEVIPEKFEFRNTSLMLDLCRKNSNDNSNLNLKKWVKSIEMHVGSAEVFSQGFPIVPDSTEIREIKPGDKYNGNVVLITDALCYSTTDIFAAGFQDNNIGKILGIHKNTGAGGGNVWSHELLRRFLNDDELMPSLPEGCEFTFAIRRSTRVGEEDDIPLEEFGVEPDCIHEMTKDDLLYRNRDLIKHAAEIILEELYKAKEATGIPAVPGQEPVRE